MGISACVTKWPPKLRKLLISLLLMSINKCFGALSYVILLQIVNFIQTNSRYRHIETFLPCARKGKHGCRGKSPTLTNSRTKILNKNVLPITSLSLTLAAAGAAFGCSGTCCCSASAMMFGPVEDVIPLPHLDVISFLSNSVLERSCRCSTCSCLNKLLVSKLRHSSNGVLVLSRYHNS